jgi:hypothetical protein
MSVSTNAPTVKEIAAENHDPSIKASGRLTTIMPR